jgi:hypothetical protein
VAGMEYIWDFGVHMFVADLMTKISRDRMGTRSLIRRQLERAS